MDVHSIDHEDNVTISPSLTRIRSCSAGESDSESSCAVDEGAHCFGEMHRVWDSRCEATD